MGSREPAGRSPAPCYSPPKPRVAVDELPAGIQVGIAILQVHRRPELYPQPETFRPERFLERSFTPFEFLPFGGGARRCIGAAFATYEMKLVLATVMRTLDLRLESAAPIRVGVRNTTVGPREEIWMRPR